MAQTQWIWTQLLGRDVICRLSSARKVAAASIFWTRHAAINSMAILAAVEVKNSVMSCLLARRLCSERRLGLPSSLHGWSYYLDIRVEEGLNTDGQCPEVLKAGDSILRSTNRVTWSQGAQTMQKRDYLPHVVHILVCKHLSHPKQSHVLACTSC